MSRVAKNMHQLRHCAVVLWSSHQAKPEPRPTELVLPADLYSKMLDFLTFIPIHQKVPIHTLFQVIKGSNEIFFLKARLGKIKKMFLRTRIP